MWNSFSSVCAEIVMNMNVTMATGLEDRFFSMFYGVYMQNVCGIVFH